VLLALAVFASRGERLSAQAGHLDSAEKPRLLDCRDSLDRPAFRLRFNPVDAQGAPLPLTFPPDQLRERLKISIEGRDVTPFSATGHNTEVQSTRARMALVLVDISGSMTRPVPSGGTRFQSAQAALKQFLQGFEEKSDEVAVVPFESHDVVNRIHAAVFAASRAQALKQVDDLPAPAPRNNTAIYSAVLAGIDVLTTRLKQAAAASQGTAPETLLVVLTDGKNEVLQGDDPGLLDGQEGLQRAAGVVKAAGVQVVAIGFGDPGSVDQAALTRLASRSFMATDAAKLNQVFAIAHSLLTDRISVTFTSPWPDRASLEGRTLRIKATLHPSANLAITSDEQTWSAPQMGVPTFDDKCSLDELRAALRETPETPRHGIWPPPWPLIRPVLVFASVGALLAALWFLVPRLVWPDQYGGDVPRPSRGRWSDEPSGAVEARRARQPAPAGFQPGGGAQPPRAAADRTIVPPQAEFTRTRLQRRPPDRERS
jgi:Mg-chelatase subunit ChlD